MTRKRFKIRRNVSAKALANTIEFVTNYLLVRREDMDETMQNMLDYLLYNLLSSDDYNRLIAEHPEWQWKDDVNAQETQ